MENRTIKTDQDIKDTLKSYQLYPVTLKLPFRLNHVNCFMGEGSDGWQVIDAGLHNQETVARWSDELDQKNVTDIIITHYHPDHFGYAGGMQAKTNASLSMPEIDAEAGMNAWQEKFISQLPENYKMTGIPSDIAEKMTENTTAFIPSVTPYPRVDHYLYEGAKVPIGKYEYEVIHTPGHSDGLVCLYNKDRNMLLSTDHILPKITPNISYWFHGNANPLSSYLNSLRKVRTLDADLVVPSHGKPFFGANDRIDEIIDHHHERLEATLDAIKGGCNVYEACEKLFRKELTIHEMRFAVGETLAHLEYLRQNGDCEREMQHGVYKYYIKSS